MFTISSCLDKLGKIDKATNGQEAFEMVRDNPENSERAYDLIFLDLEMPIKNGFEACTMIRNHYKHIQEERSFQIEEENKLPKWLEDLNFVK